MSLEPNDLQGDRVEVLRDASRVNLSDELRALEDSIELLVFCKTSNSRRALSTSAAMHK